MSTWFTMEPNEITIVGNEGLPPPRGMLRLGGGDTCCTVSELDAHRAGGGPCALVVGNGVGGDACGEHEGDVPSMKMYHDEVIPGDRRETPSRRYPHHH